MRARAKKRIPAEVAAALLVTSVLGLSACSEAAEEPTAIEQPGHEKVIGDDPVADVPYAGPYDGGFYESIESYEGQTVTVTGDRVLSPMSFTIVGADGAREDLLVVGATEMRDVQADTTVQVTGTVHEVFDRAEIEGLLGTNVDDEQFQELDAVPYIVADDVDTSMAADG